MYVLQTVPNYCVLSILLSFLITAWPQFDAVPNPKHQLPHYKIIVIGQYRDIVQQNFVSIDDETLHMITVGHTEIIIQR